MLPPTPQPTPEIVALFDDVVLLRDGAEIYHGPRSELRSYIAGLGFLPPPDVTLHGLDGAVLPGPALDGSGANKSAPVADSPSSAADLADWVSEWVTFPARRHQKDGVARSAPEGSASPQSQRRDPPTTTDALVRAWKSHALYAAQQAPSSATSGSVPVLALESEFARLQYSRRYVHNPLVHLFHVVRRQGLLMFRNLTFLSERKETAWR